MLIMVEILAVLQFMDLIGWTMEWYLSIVMAINVKHVACSVTCNSY